jgi:uncharacterized iron-regulated membrane protein
MQAAQKHFLLPFHFIVALTGAVMGVALIMFTLAGPVLFGGDGAKAMTAVYGDPAVIAEQARRAEAPANAIPEARIVAALETLRRERPDNPALYMTLNQFGTPDEGVAIGAGHGTRLIYAETYRFDNAGGLMSSDGYADGEIGRQFYASMFRAHAGAFGGLPVKLLYVLLGLGLTFICTTGVDIWLAKSAARGRAYPPIQSTWTVFVWATPALIALVCTLSLALNAPPVPLFWIALPLVSLAGIWIPQHVAHWAGPLAAAVAIASLPLAHVARFGLPEPGSIALGVNGGLILVAVGLLALGFRNRRRIAQFVAPEPASAATA